MTEIVNADINPFYLAREINTSGAIPSADEKLEAGKKLIRIRQYLEMKNGRVISGRAGADGLNPVGWGDFRRAHLLLSEIMISRLIRYAIDPHGTRAKEKAYLLKRDNSWGRAKTTFNVQFKRDPEGAEEFVRYCIERISEHERKRTQSAT